MPDINNPLHSTIHLCVEGLEELLRIHDRDARKKKSQNGWEGAVIDKSDLEELGFNIVHYTDLSLRDLMLLPDHDPSKLEAARRELATLEEDPMNPRDLHAYKKSLHDLRTDLIRAYPWRSAPYFIMLPMWTRKIVFTGRYDHWILDKIEQKGEQNWNYFLDEYEKILDEYRSANHLKVKEGHLYDLVRKRGIAKTLDLHISFIRAIKQAGYIKPRKERHTSHIQLINSFLLQALELEDPKIFRQVIFWHMRDVLRLTLSNEDQAIRYGDYYAPKDEEDEEGN